MRIMRRVAAVGVCVAVGGLAGCHGGKRGAGFGSVEPVRAVWVTRWDYKTPQDVAAVMENCRLAGFNTVLWQVRGAGTALYRSRIEPWAPEFEGKDPGFDPLMIACKEAHKRGMTLHAWMNVMPAWHGKTPPTDRRQLYHSKPQWFLTDAQGRRQPFGWYMSLNPCLPEVRQYLVSVCYEIITRYPVDGLHLDYIRIPNDYHDGYAALGSVPDYPRDAQTLSMFRRATGKTPEQDPTTWRNWRASQVNLLVKQIAEMMNRARPNTALTAAVGADPDHAFNAHYQDARRWIAQGWVDGVFTMNYSGTLAEFDRRADKWTPWAGKAVVAQGVMFDKRSAGVVGAQVQSSVRRGGHFAAFAYNSLFERRGEGGRLLTDAQSASRDELRRQVLPAIRALPSSAPRAAALSGK